MPRLKNYTKTVKRLEPTPKERVLNEFPNAYAKEGLMSGDWYIHHNRHVLGKGATAAAAWRNAAKLNAYV